ncbi:SPOR domain-containing protein [Hirschia litorea]|uniref:SPOR domain-containing protein n=1 Tax=Hirschia litorea TaxID=1199156 RepID=A0ABW2IM26_9PROT
MSISSKIIFSFAFALVGFQSANAQSLPVPMPAEERQELAQARYRQAQNAQIAQHQPSYQTGTPLGRPLVEARKESSPSAPTAEPLQTLSSDATGYMIKAGSFRSFANAQSLHAKLYAIGSARIIPRQANGMDFYGVYLGPWATEAEAFQAFSLAMDAGMEDGKIIDPE